MATNSSLKRTLQQVVDDGLYPCDDLCPEPEMQGKRYCAIAAVLQRLPKAAYAALITAKGTFDWFLPDTYLWGLVYPVFSRCEQINDALVSLFPAIFRHEPAYRDTIVHITIVLLSAHFDRFSGPWWENRWR